MKDFLDWIKEAQGANTFEESARLNKDVFDRLSKTDYRGFIYRVRLIQDLHPSVGTYDQHPYTEIYVENMTEGIRISYYFQGLDKLVGRAYFDKGNIPAEEVRTHIAWMDSLIDKGRPRESLPLPLSDEEIFERIRTRSDWCTFDDPATSKRITITDAIDRLIYQYKLIEDDESQYEAFFRAFELAYEREKRKRRKK